MISELAGLDLVFAGLLQPAVALVDGPLRAVVLTYRGDAARALLCASAGVGFGSRADEPAELREHHATR
jgi:hypothetical protein